MANVAHAKKTPDSLTTGCEDDFVAWLLSVDTCALANGARHRCKGPRHAVSWPAAGAHVLLCERAFVELHARTGFFDSWTDGDITAVFGPLFLTALVRCETAALEAQLAARRAA